ncbi:hypothetical protein ACIHFD_04385 [Nonomuraea sp. NPDC051941]
MSTYECQAADVPAARWCGERTQRTAAATAATIALPSRSAWW